MKISTIKFIILNLIIGFTITSCKRQSKITGVVTYFFNENFGQKPDVGAEIYFLEKGEQDLFDFTTPWTFSKISPHHRENYNKILDWKSNILKNEMSENAFADSVSVIQTAEALERENAINYFKSLMKNDQLKCTANGNGEFSINLPKGHYYVLVVFSHRDAIDIGYTSQDFENDTQVNYAFEESDLD
jgi:hypothetical protein